MKYKNPWTCTLQQIYERHFPKSSSTLSPAYINIFQKIKQETSGFSADYQSYKKNYMYLYDIFKQEGFFSNPEDGRRRENLVANLLLSEEICSKDLLT